MSSPLSVNIIGLDSFIADAEKAGMNLQPLMRAALQNSVTRIQSNVRQEAPHKTGSLQRSVLTSVDYPVGQVTVDEPYGMYVEYGTAPHIIQPKNKKALFWKGALNPYKTVHHPGTKANPFFATGVRQSSEYVRQQYLKVITRVVKELAGH